MPGIYNTLETALTNFKRRLSFYLRCLTLNLTKYSKCWTSFNSVFLDQSKGNDSTRNFKMSIYLYCITRSCRWRWLRRQLHGRCTWRLCWESRLFGRELVQWWARLRKVGGRPHERFLGPSVVPAVHLRACSPSVRIGCLSRMRARSKAWNLGNFWKI